MEDGIQVFHNCHYTSESQNLMSNWARQLKPCKTISSFLYSLLINKAKLHFWSLNYLGSIALVP